MKRLLTVLEIGPQSVEGEGEARAENRQGCYGNYDHLPSLYAEAAKTMRSGARSSTAKWG